MKNRQNLIFKILLIGNSNTGKSAIINSISGGVFDKSYVSTIGVDFAIKHITLKDEDTEINVKLQIWDTAGQESFRSITRSYYRDSAGVIIVYDITI